MRIARSVAAVMMMAGCVAPATEQVSTQSIQDTAVTYRFSGSLPKEGETCQQTAVYRNSLCGTRFHGYLTVPNTPSPDYAIAYYETPYDEQGRVFAPYGMVLHVDGRPPRILPYVSVSIANDVTNPFRPDDPSLVDALQISGSASYSNDGFAASFMDPTGTAIDDQELLPDPARFPAACSDSWDGCPTVVVVGDAAADFRAMELHVSRSPIVVAAPNQERENPYFMIAATDWLDAERTAVTFTLEIYDTYTFGSPTCDLWVQLDEAAGAPLHAVQSVVHHDGHRQQRAMLTIETGAANPARELRAVNVTCGFALPGEPIVENTLVWY